jgi:hypothetical protein
MVSEKIRELETVAHAVENEATEKAFLLVVDILKALDGQGSSPTEETHET